MSRSCAAAFPTLWGSLVREYPLPMPKDKCLCRATELKRGTLTESRFEAASFGRLARGELLGSPEEISFNQTAQGVRIERPRQKPASDYAVVFKLSLA